MRRKTWLVTLKGPKWMSSSLDCCCFDDDDPEEEGSVEVLIVIFSVGLAGCNHRGR